MESVRSSVIVSRWMLSIQSLSRGWAKLECQRLHSSVITADDSPWNHITGIHESELRYSFLYFPPASFEYLTSDLYLWGTWDFLLKLAAKLTVAPVNNLIFFHKINSLKVMSSCLLIFLSLQLLILTKRSLRKVCVYATTLSSMLLKHCFLVNLCFLFLVTVWDKLMMFPAISSV